MAQVTWTKEQKQAIEEKGSNLLVAAAAGSGKTAVLVERIIHKVLDEKMDIDKMLVVTFTNAAASEMRERILDAIYKKIEEYPDDLHLQRQITLLNKASICTIHAFCLEIIRNYFYEIDTSANFRIGDTAEIELLKQEVLEEVFEEQYTQNRESFIELLNTYATYRGDEPLKELILTIYTYMQSMPFPEKWLQEKVEMFNEEQIQDEDFASTIWGKILLQDLSEVILQNTYMLKNVKRKLDQLIELEKYAQVIRSDIDKLKTVQNQITEGKQDTWDKVYTLTNNLQFDKWPVDKKVTNLYKEEAKQVRDTVKKNISKEVKKVLTYDSKQAKEDLQNIYPTLVSLQEVILAFTQAFQSRKKEKNIVDFHDIEHFALKILLKEDENGEFVQTQVALKQQEKYEEIAIDEYQDSNMVQEYILNSIAKGNNLFMVGDVKQSIYKFRQARPELFLEKYQNYQSIENKLSQTGRKIQLFKNFRSRETILTFTNFIFSEIMSKKLGDMDYTQEEYLNLGANYEPLEEMETHTRKIEIDVIDLGKTQEIEEGEEEEEADDKNIIENTVLEAKYVSQKIKELIEKGYLVWDKKQNQYRKITYKDIVILLRATSHAAPIYEKELSQQNMPVFSDTSAQYLESTEIQNILSILKIMDNPLQDIPLVTVLRSPIGNFTDNDLVEIRLADPTSYFYYAILKARISAKKTLREKIDRMLTWLEKWKQEEQEKSLDELIWQIYLDTNYYHYVGLMPNGALRQANLKMLFEKAKQYETANFKGLFQFINFMEKVRTSNKDMSAAKIIGENEDVIRIMSIHKSKGLEFPVVFLCGTGKKCNMQDLNQSIILHQDMGFGPNYRNTSYHIEYPTLAKEAIRIQTKTETIAEEMRVLYVALTRAKEKLYITGVSKDWNKSIAEKEAILEMDKQDTINPIFLKKYPCYLDWITLVALKQKTTFEKIAQIQVHNCAEIPLEEEQQEQENLQKRIEKEARPGKEKQEEIAKIMNWVYPYQNSIEIPTKTSVTYIKEQKQTEEGRDIPILSLEEMQKQIEESVVKNEINDNKTTTYKTNYQTTLAEPKFRKQETITAARKGTLIHMCLQHMDERKTYTKENLKTWLQELVEKEYMTKEEAQSIPIMVLYQYTQSTLWKSLTTAKEIHKEEPFYRNILAKDIYPMLESDNQEKILVQGMIDLYYIDEQDNLILVDYKTDYVETGKEQILIEKYKEQLDFYKQALEEALNRKVDRIEIYSTYLQKSVLWGRRIMAILSIETQRKRRKKERMRLDKFLKVSRVIKRRTVANEAADGGRVSVNGKIVKPSYEVKVGDIIEIKFGDKISKFEILQIPKVAGKEVGEIIKVL